MFPDYLQKIDLKNNKYHEGQIGFFVQQFEGNESAEILKKSVGIISIQRLKKENQNTIFAKGIREELFQLFHEEISIIDMGDLKQGNTILDTDYAIEDLIKNIQNNFAKIIIITDDNTYLEKSITVYSKTHYLQENTLSISPQKDIDFLGTLLDKKSTNFHLNILGYQNYYFPEKLVSELQENCHETYRLGLIKEHSEITETILRRSDLNYFSMNAIRNSDFKFSEEPNGYRAEEACKLFYYDGYSSQSRQTIIGDYLENYEENKTAKKLVAQLIWHVLSGFKNKVNEHPETHQNQFIKYTTALQNENLPLYFFQNQISKRWWMEMEHPLKGKQNTKNLIVPCTQKDYESAVNGETPELWWIMTNRFAVS